MPLVNNSVSSTIEHIVVIWNELNILTYRNGHKSLLTKRKYQWLYFKYKELLYSDFYGWVIRNFDVIKMDLFRLNLIWTPKDNTSLVIKSNKKSNKFLTMDQMVALNPLPGATNA